MKDRCNDGKEATIPSIYENILRSLGELPPERAEMVEDLRIKSVERSQYCLS